MPLSTSCLWTIVKIFKMRAMVQPWITYVIGSGNRTFYQLDNWHQLGPLFTRFGAKVVYNLGRSIHAKVASIIRGQHWQWPRLLSYLM